MTKISKHQQIKTSIKDMLDASDGKNRSNWDIADEALGIVEAAGALVATTKKPDPRIYVNVNLKIITHPKTGKQHLSLVTDDGQNIGRQISVQAVSRMNTLNIACLEVYIDKIFTLDGDHGAN